MKRLILPVIALGACFLAACNGTATVSTGTVDTTAARNKAAALASEKTLMNKDVDGLVKICAPGFVDYGSGEGPAMKNLDSIKAGLKEFFAAIPDYKGENMNAVASGDSVIVTATWSGTFKNDFMGMKATGKTFKYDDADIFTFTKDGKMLSHRSTQSMAAFMTQTGAQMPAMPAKK